jgi:hypothetical protein
MRKEDPSTEDKSFTRLWEIIKEMEWWKKNEVKKLSSRQDVLDVFVEKWAVITWKELHKVSRIKVVWNIVEVNKCAELYYYNLYEILYSQESNFFEVMYTKKFANKILSTDLWFEWRDTCNYDSTDSIMPAFTGNLCDYHKMMCAISSDPLQYLIDNLNETLGSQ